MIGVNNTWTNIYNRQIHPEEQILYNHWLELVQLETPAELIDRFRTLFIDCTGYPDRSIAQALEKLAASKQAEQEFKYILNRCCHILINRWQTYPSKQAAIPELMAVFEDAPFVVFGNSRSRAIGCIPQLVHQFIASDSISHSNASPKSSPTIGKTAATAKALLPTLSEL